MESVSVYENELVYDDIINYLKNIDLIPNKMFSKIYHYFMNQQNLQNLSEDQKCLLAASLIQLDIDMPNEKKHNCKGKKSILKSYYDEHIINCSEEMQKRIHNLEEDRLLRNIKTRKLREEIELQEKYPTIYKELIDYRTEKNKEKKYIRH